MKRRISGICVIRSPNGRAYLQLVRNEILGQRIWKYKAKFLTSRSVHFIVVVVVSVFVVVVEVVVAAAAVVVIVACITLGARKLGTKETFIDLSSSIVYTYWLSLLCKMSLLRFDFDFYIALCYSK